jgi:hypothetical protein
MPRDCEDSNFNRLASLMLSKKIALFGFLLALQSLSVLDATLSIAGQDSILEKLLLPASFVASLIFPIFATIGCLVMYGRIYQVGRVRGTAVVFCFLLAQLLACNAVYRFMAARSFSESQNAALSFLKAPHVFNASYGDDVDEGLVTSLKSQVVDIIPVQSLQRYQSYEFIVRPKNGNLFIIQIRGRGDLRRLFVYRNESVAFRLTQRNDLENFELPLLNVSLK